MGDGMEQGEARRRAKAYTAGALAVSARRNSAGKWITGGWPSEKDVWIVMSLDGQVVLDDGAGKPSAEERIPVVALEEKVSMLLAEKHPAAVMDEHGKVVRAGIATSRDMGGRVWVTYRAPAQTEAKALAAERRRVLTGCFAVLAEAGWDVKSGDLTGAHPTVVATPRMQ